MKCRGRTQSAESKPKVQRASCEHNCSLALSQDGFRVQKQQADHRPGAPEPGISWVPGPALLRTNWSAWGKFLNLSPPTAPQLWNRVITASDRCRSPEDRIRSHLGTLRKTAWRTGRVLWMAVFAATVVGYFIDYIGVIPVHKITQVSGVQLYNTSSVQCMVRSPAQVFVHHHLPLLSSSPSLPFPSGIWGFVVFLV